jgi:hypothetical protein
MIESKSLAIPIHRYIYIDIQNLWRFTFPWIPFNTKLQTEIYPLILLINGYRSYGEMNTYLTEGSPWKLFYNKKSPDDRKLCYFEKLILMEVVLMAWVCLSWWMGSRSINKYGIYLDYKQKRRFPLPWDFSYFTDWTYPIQIDIIKFYWINCIQWFGDIVFELDWSYILMR